jgi:hypothetical protein
MAEALEDDIVAAASGVGNVTQTGVAKSGIETVNAVNPTQNRYYAIGYNSTTTAVEYCQIDGTSSSNITGVANLPLDSFTADAQGLASRFNTDVISFLRRKAREVITDTYGGVSLKIPKLTPVKINGKETYVMVISRLQEKSLRADSKWITSQQEANVRGEDNPIFSGAIGIWDGVVIKVSERAQYRVGAGGTTATEYFNDYTGSNKDAIDTTASGSQVDRGMFFGANAVVVAYAQMPQKHTTMEDVGRIPTVAVDSLYGVKNVAFNYYNTTSWATSAGTNIATELYGTIVFDTVVDPD